MNQRRVLLIDPLSKTSRMEQTFNWIAANFSAGEHPTKLPMRVVRTALTRKDRQQLLIMVNQQLGARYGFTAQWTGNRKGALAMRLVWDSD